MALSIFNIVHAVVGVLFLGFTAWAGVVFLQIPLYVLLCFSPKLQAYSSNFIVGTWWSLTVWYIEIKNRTKVVFFGDKIPQQEDAILICNHTSAIDWMFCWSLGIRKGSLGHIKNVLKSTLMIIPIFGWAFKLALFLHLDRDWSRDAATIKAQTSYISKHKLPVWLLLFPEGTRLTPQKLKNSQKFAKENNLPALENLLTPRTKGWVSCCTGLRDHCSAIYDITLTYEPRQIPKNTFAVLLSAGYPDKCFMNIHRYPIKDLPRDEAGLAEWCHARFAEKDKSIAHFHRTGKFLNPDGSEASAIDHGAVPPISSAIVALYFLWGLFCSYLYWEYSAVRVYNVVVTLVLTIYTAMIPVSSLLYRKKSSSSKK